MFHCDRIPIAADEFIPSSHWPMPPRALPAAPKPADHPKIRSRPGTSRDHWRSPVTGHQCHRSHSSACISHCGCKWVAVTSSMTKPPASGRGKCRYNWKSSWKSHLIKIIQFDSSAKSSFSSGDRKVASETFRIGRLPDFAWQTRWTAPNVANFAYAKKW